MTPSHPTLPHRQDASSDAQLFVLLTHGYSDRGVTAGQFESDFHEWRKGKEEKVRQSLCMRQLVDAVNYRLSCIYNEDMG